MGNAGKTANKPTPGGLNGRLFLPSHHGQMANPAGLVAREGLIN
jgi:hypothetical protein